MGKGTGRPPPGLATPFLRGLVAQAVLKTRFRYNAHGDYAALDVFLTRGNAEASFLSPLRAGVGRLTLSVEEKSR